MLPELCFCYYILQVLSSSFSCFRFDSEAEPTFCRSLVLLLLLFHLVLLPLLLLSSMFFEYIIHTDVSLCSDCYCCCFCFSCIEKCLDTVGLNERKHRSLSQPVKSTSTSLNTFRMRRIRVCACVYVCTFSYVRFKVLCVALQR